ncbi:MAG: DUF2889 domain-containing protein [Ilumatobacteraceae bacterium]
MGVTSRERMPAAMLSPSDAAIERRVPSIRRTSNIDTRRVDGQVLLTGAVRDLVTTSAGADVTGSASVDAVIDAAGRLSSIETTPVRSTGGLVGRTIGPGFRDAVRDAVPDEVATGTPLALLLDDLPVAALISGYALLYSGESPVAPAGGGSLKADICSGWRSDGTMMVAIARGRGVPLSIGPSAPVIADEEAREPRAWHPMAPLPASSMRRRRLLDVHPTDDGWQITAMFRDTHSDGDAVETVLHEYVLTAIADPTTGVLTTCAAVPRVLPWVECPVAAASADRLVGRDVGSVRSIVRSELRGTSTCTHLNDLLRSLGDVPVLADALTR